MSPRGVALAALMVLLLGTSLTAPPAVADSDSLVLHDKPHDAGDLPCSSATDLLRFGASWGEDGVLLEYRFLDLSVVDSTEALLQDIEGSCFWSYTHFVAEFASGEVADAVYIDHNSNPLWNTGWRVYLHENRTALPATIEGNEISVMIPYDVLGQPVAGDRIGEFRIQVSNSLDGKALTYNTDWVPDDGRPCGCWLDHGGE